MACRFTKRGKRFCVAPLGDRWLPARVLVWKRELWVKLATLGWGVFFGVLVGVRAACPAVREDLPRETVIAWLRHQEGLVRSADCHYRCTVVETQPDMAARIRELAASESIQSKIPRKLETNILSKELAAWWSYESHWQRKGVKEREDKRRIGPDPMPERGDTGETTAFDGQVVRTLGAAASLMRGGGVHTRDGGHWDAQLAQPFSFLYEFVHGEPFSKIVAEGRDFSGSITSRDGKPVARVTVSDKARNISWEMIFDKEHRLLERAARHLSADRRTASTYERHSFSDYRAHTDPSGETIWFPHKAEYRFYIDRLSDYGLIEWRCDVFDIEDIQFNVEIPDDVFVIDFPKDVQVYDGVNGFGFIRAADLERVERRVQRRTIWAWVTVGIAAGVVFLFVGRWLRKRALDPRQQA